MGVTPKNSPTVKKGSMKGKKWHQNLNNASFNRATTKIFWPIVNPELQAYGNVILNWPLTTWFLFTDLFSILKGPFLPLKWVLEFLFLILKLLDSHKDVVSGKILVFGNILGFSGVNWPRNGSKPSTLGTSRFRLNT